MLNYFMNKRIPTSLNLTLIISYVIMHPYTYLNLNQLQSSLKLTLLNKTLETYDI